MHELQLVPHMYPRYVLHDTVDDDLGHERRTGLVGLVVCAGALARLGCLGVAVGLVAINGLCLTCGGANLLLLELRSSFRVRHDTPGTIGSENTERSPVGASRSSRRERGPQNPEMPS